jgi:RNA polymerase sigma-70 factor, ECF subfamily
MTDPLVNMKGALSEPPSSTSISLLERVQSGEESAWERMVTLYYPLVCRWCAYKGLQPHDCVDVAQDVFVAVAKYIPRFRKESQRDSFCAWLRTIAQSKLNDYWRRQEKQARSIGGSEARRWLSELPGETAEETDVPLGIDEEAIVVRAALDALSVEFEPRTWKAFWRVAVDGQPAAHVAEELNTSSNAVYLAKSRVLRRLREELEEWALNEQN